jgi:hypothetical protein
MGLQQIVQMLASVANVLTVVIFAVGYYFMIRLYREWLRESREARQAGGRPQVVVSADYSHLPEVSITVRNFNQAPAKDVTFEFSAPVEDPDGNVISDLPYLAKGLDFLEPGGSVSRYWGRLPDLARMLREKEIEEGIKVTTRYRDLANERYETEWTLNPLRFEDSGIENSKDMNDLVNAIERLPERAAPERVPCLG